MAAVAKGLMPDTASWAQGLLVAEAYCPGGDGVVLWPGHNAGYRCVPVTEPGTEKPDQHP
jgi:hypothetical protein